MKQKLQKIHIIFDNLRRIFNIKAFSKYLVSIIHEINNITSIHNDIFPNCTSKDPLQNHSTNNSCDRKPTFCCGSECIKLDIPDNQLNINSWYKMLRFRVKEVADIILFHNFDIKETRLLFDKEMLTYINRTLLCIFARSNHMPSSTL